MPLVTKSFANAVSFTRASNATYFDSSGVLQTASANTARIDYNPSTLAIRGLLVEESRTNSIRNNTMVDAVAGTPGTSPTNWVVPGTVNGLTQTISVGTENGIAYVDFRYAGTTTASSSHQISFEAANQIAAASGQTWTRSAWFKTQAGSTANLTVNHNLQGRDAGNITFTEAFVTDITASLTGTLTRLSTASTLANASTAFVRSAVTFVYNNGVAIDITLRIGMPQLEQGAFATSVISTSTAAATRSADVAIVNVNRWFYDTESTIYIETAIEGVGSSNYPWSIAVDNGTSSNRYGFYFVDAGADTYNKKMSTNGVGQIDEAGPVTLVANTFIKSAMAVKTNDLAAAYNGGNLQTDSSVNIPTNLTRLLIGSGDNTWSGWIKSVKYYPRRLSNAELITLTT